MKPLIIIPALDEAASIADVIRDIRENGWHDILVVDDASCDRTAQISAENGAGVVRLPVNLGAWGAIQTGMRYALENGYPAAVTMDGDNQHKPEYIADLVRSLAEENDVVIGSCLSRGSVSKQMVWPFLRRLSGLDVRDLTSGFRAYSREAMTLLVNRESLLLDYQDIGVLLLCSKNDLKITEVNVRMDQREDGKSRIFKNIFMIIRYFFSTLFLIGTKRW